jgi:hypothetical protein
LARAFLRRLLRASLTHGLGPSMAVGHTQIKFSFLT